MTVPPIVATQLAVSGSPRLGGLFEDSVDGVARSNVYVAM